MFVEREEKERKKIKVLVFSHEKKDALTGLVVQSTFRHTSN